MTFDSFDGFFDILPEQFKRAWKTYLIFVTFLSAGVGDNTGASLIFSSVSAWVKEENKIMSKLCRIRGNLLEKDSKSREQSDTKFQMRPND